MPEVLEIQIQDKGGGGGGGPPRPPNPQGGGGGAPAPPPQAPIAGAPDLGRIPGAVIGDLLPYYPRMLDLLTEQTVLLGDIAGHGHAPPLPGGSAAKPGGGEPRGPSLTGGLSKLGIQAPANIAAGVARAGQGAEEVAGALGASEGAIAALGGAATVAGGILIGAALGAAVPLGILAGTFKVATDRIEIFGLKLSSAIDELTNFNPALAMAQVNRDVTRFMDDFREAQEVGPDLARLVDAQSAIEHELREAFLPIKQFFAETAADFMQDVQTGLLPEIKGTLGAILEVLKVLLELMNDAFGDGKLADIPDLLGKLPGRLMDAYTKAKNHMASPPADGSGFLKLLYDQQGVDARAAEPRRGVNDPRPNIPAVAPFAGL